jgi:hypothetical protein
MKLNTKTGRIAAVVAVAGVVLFGATTASAGGSPTIPDGSVGQSDMAKPVNDLYLKTQGNSVGKPQLKVDVASELELGKGSVIWANTAQRIDEIGGSFVDDRTLLGGFHLDPGTWLITTNATFNRTKTARKGATQTRPQVALRYGRVKGGEASAGTIAGVDISPTKGHELLGSSVQTVTTTANVTTVWVYGFGENDDNSHFASGQITAAAQITATRIG